MMRTTFMRPAFLLPFQDTQTQNTIWRTIGRFVTTPPELDNMRIPGTSTHVLGSIPIPSGRVLITDPGYEIKVGELLEYPDGSLCNRILDCVPGNYEVRYTKTGKRSTWVHSLGIFHFDCKTVQPNEFTPPVLAVDSGRMSFSDANHKVPLFGLSDCDLGLVNWHGALVATCSPGDGGYPLLVARDPEGRIIAAEVLFDWNEDYDDGDDE